MVRHPAEERHLRVMALQREYAEQLIRGVEALTVKLSDTEHVARIDLDLLDRYERALTKAHVANQLRVAKIPASILAEDEQYSEATA